MANQHFIKQISVTNFKSFRSLDIELDNFNVLIGANASGKSNFLEIFRFIRDIALHGLDNAISLQGGVEYLRNTNIGADGELTVKLVYQPKFIEYVSAETKMTLRSLALIHEFALGFSNKEYQITRDQLTRKMALFEIEMEDDKIVEEKKSDEGEVVVLRIGDRFEYTLSDNLSGWVKEPPHPFLFDSEIPYRPNLLLLEPSISDFIGGTFGQKLTNMPIYDFTPKTSKQAIPVTGKMELEEDGSNLPVVLKYILEDEEKRRKFLNLSQYLLDFVEDVRVEDMAGKFLFLTLKERSNLATYLPANLMSEGTISLLCLLVAAHFEDKPLLMIEEPERNIHPFLITKVVEILKEVSANKQVVITTHNPEIVKQVDLGNILLMSKDKDGFSTISKPSENDHIKTFLENEIGVDDLYTQNLLEV